MVLPRPSVGTAESARREDGAWAKRVVWVPSYTRGGMTATPSERSGGVAAPRGRVSWNALLLSIATVVARLSAFALSVVMGRHLGPAGYGIYGYAAALSIVLIPIADLGLTPYITREVARDRAHGEALLDRLVSVRVATTVGLLSLVALAAIASGKSTESVIVIILVVASGLLDGLSQVFFGYFVGRERMALEATLTTGTAVLRAIGGITILLATGELLPVAAWILVVGIGQTFCTYTRTRSSCDQVPTDTPPVMWRTVLSLGATAIAVMVYMRADTVLIGSILGDREVGWYAAAYTLMLGLQIMPHMVGRALLPVFARTWSAGERGSFLRAWRIGTRAVCLVSLPLSLAFSVLADPIMRRLFGVGFDPASAALAILVWSSPLAVLNYVAFGALRAAGRDSLLTGLSVLAALANITLNLWVIPTYGLRGAAAVTVGTEAVVLIAQTASAVRTGLLPFPRLPYARMGLSLGALAAVAVALDDGMVEVALAASLACYAILLAVTGVLRSADVAMVKNLLQRRS